MPWQPTSIVVEDWARLQLVVNNTDVTYYRGVPFQLGGWTKNEPFGDATMTVKFPQITSLEALPPWLVDNADVDLFGWTPAGTRLTLFEGLWISEDSALSETDDGLTITVAGALYQNDFYRKTPELRRYSGWDDDIAYLLQAAMDSTQKPALRTMPLIIPGLAGVAYGQRGGWEQALTGYAQTLLAIGTNSGLPQPGEPIVGLVGHPAGGGYWLVGSMGSVLAFGAARYFGSTVGLTLTKPATGIAAAPSGKGYWFAARDGGVFTFSYEVGFQGSLGSSPPATDIEAIDAMPTGQGYAMVAEDGSVYNFGNSGYHGGPNGSLVAGDKAIDICMAPGGTGYIVVTQFGYVYAYGTASYFGGVNSNAIRIVAAAMRPQGDGYWLLREDGYIYGYGVAATGAIPNQFVPISVKAADLHATPSGGGLWVADETGGVFAIGTATYHGSVPDGGGHVTQWTIGKQAGRQPILKIKNVWDVQWRVSCADQGVSHSLTRDTLMSPNVLYGEGIDPEGCIWRNTKYPNYNAEAAPVFSGVELKVGSTHGDVVKWQRQMRGSGWTNIVEDGVFRQRDSNVAREFQRQAGLTETGTVNAQTWAASFQVGSNASDLFSSYYAPLAAARTVEPNLYNAKGDVIGANPNFNRNVARIEGYDNYGAQVTKHEGVVSAQGRLDRDYPSTYFGTLTLRLDPEEGSRFAIEPGDNLVYRYFRGNNPQFHVASVDVNWDDGSVTLTVDTQARDMATLAVMRQRIRDVANPVGNPSGGNRQSQQTEDRKITWDCESGAGIVPYHAVNGGLWNVLRIPCGEFGQVNATDFTTATPARLGVAVFNKEVTPNMLASKGASPFEIDYWEGDFWEDWGLLMAWGGKDQAGGFYPGTESDGDPVTGRLVDDASWNFEAVSPPWLWIAMWVESPGVNYISGRLKPGVLT